VCTHVNEQTVYVHVAVAVNVAVNVNVYLNVNDLKAG
jgi:hypothetical protein